MAGFYTPFHATLDELCDIIEAWLDQHPIVISAFAFPPCTRVDISRDTLRDVLGRPDIGEVVFTQTPVDPSLSSACDVGTAGSASVQLNIGRLKPSGLEQSNLSTGYDDPIWKKINRDLKRHTTAGADYVNDTTGKVSQFARDARFTPGAKALDASGTRLRQPGETDVSYRPK